MFTSYRKLKAWELGDKLAFAVYQVTRGFPKSELYGLTSQLRRAGLSVPTNVAEGYSRRNDKYFKNFLDMAYGSLVETEYLLGFARKLDFLPEEVYNELMQLIDETGKVLWKLREKVASRKE